MKKAIKKTCVVLLLFALLASQVAASYSETGTLNEGTSAISAAERYLSNWAYNSYMYADKNLTLGTVLDAEVDPAIEQDHAVFQRITGCHVRHTVPQTHIIRSKAADIDHQRSGE